MSDSSEEKEKTEEKQRVNPAGLEVPETLPVLPVHGFVFFPGMGFPLNIRNPASRSLIDAAVVGNRILAIVARRPDAEEKDPPGRDELYRVGVMGYIHKMVKGDDEVYQVLMSAVRRIRITGFTESDEPYLVARVEPVASEFESDTETDALILHLRGQFRKLVDMSGAPSELLMTVNAIKDPFQIAYLIASQLNLELAEEQNILEIDDLKELLNRVARHLNRHLETLEMAGEIQKAVKEDMDAKQRDFFLRQQLKAIKKELGEDDENVEITELEEKIAEARLSEEARAAADRELGRLKRIPPSSPEYTVSRNYLDWILDLPWGISTEDRLDLDEARKVLDADHYGLEKIKKRILEFLAVRKLRADMHGPILCFAGPPGVGKTSLGQSIARALGRKFVRISLGGVRDEAEIRGHRRTYIGSRPGRIIQSLKKAGSNNPLFMLDEVDKLGKDFRGDPSTALLEVLDPEQNREFRDHYLEVAFDLSQVMFITTANWMDPIPEPLKDRMEIIEFPGYTESEKVAIAQGYLIPRQVVENGLRKDEITFSEEAIRAIIRSYTREAGVRNLERELAAICRGVASEIARGRTDQVVVTVDNLYDYLGPVRYYSEVKARTWGPGLATGLAWTPVGGVILFIETSMMKGNGGLTLTGKLGDVMQESAQAALSYVRSRAMRLGLDPDFYQKVDIHVHVPEGAIPKDGPSAGITIATAIVSALLKLPVRRTLAMTGEITLRGRVLPIGGLTEKLLAARRGNITHVLVPKENERDLKEVPARIRGALDIELVDHMDEVLQKALIVREGEPLFKDVPMDVVVGDITLSSHNTPAH